MLSNSNTCHQLEWPNSSRHKNTSGWSAPRKLHHHFVTSQPPCSCVVACHKATVFPWPKSEQHLVSPFASPTLPLFQERPLAQRDAASLDGEKTLSEPLWHLDVDNKERRVWGSCFEWGYLTFSALRQLQMFGSYFTFSPCEYTVA